MQGNKMNLLEVLRSKRFDQSITRTTQATYQQNDKQQKKTNNEIKSFINLHPRTNLLHLLKYHKPMVEECSQKNIRGVLNQYYQNVRSPTNIQEVTTKISQENSNQLYIQLPQQKFQRKNSFNSQNSIFESPNELEHSFLLQADNISRIDPDEYSIRVENLPEDDEELQVRYNRSKSQIVSDVKPFIQYEQVQLPLDTPQNKDILGLPSKSIQRQSSLTLIDSTTSKYSQQLKVNSLEQRRSIRLLRKNSSQAKETLLLEKSTDEFGRKRLNNYVVLQELGRGNFGKVKLVYDSENNQYFAMKIANKSKLKKRFLTKQTTALSLLEQEIAILKKIDHQNVVRLFEVIDDPEESKLYLIMEHVKKGSIYSKAYWKAQGLNEDDIKPKLSLEQIRKYLRDFLLGLDYLHNFARIVHRDIKPDNLLIGIDDHLKIADFGVSQIIEDTQHDLIQGEIGTKTFFPPEMFNNQPVKGRAADIWATGVTFYMITQGQSPFQAKTLAQLKEQVLNQEITFSNDTDPDLKDFLRLCLQKDQKLRSNLEQLMEHQFVTQNGQDPLLEQEYDNKFIISEKDVYGAISKVTVRATVRVTAKLKIKLSQTRKRLKSRSASQIQ